METNTDTELQLINICEKLLSKSGVEKHNNFFDLGGDSLIAMRLIGQMQTIFHKKVTMEAIFKFPMLHELAKSIDAKDTQVKCAVKEKPRYVNKQDNSMQTESLKLSLFFFSANSNEQSNDKYKLFLESSKFADENGFHSIWTPERHFSNFGGLYPNPAVLGSALAAMTKNIQIRAGSVVVPFHNPLRVVEDWSVIDNLSNGRVGIACASGWHVNDFVLAPRSYQDRKDILDKNIDAIRDLWQGKEILLANGMDKEIKVRAFPRPLQPELPIWLASHADQTFIQAAQKGIYILMTHWDKDPDEVARQVKLYKEEFKKHHAPKEGYVTLMIHSYIHTSVTTITNIITEAYGNYLQQNMNLLEKQVQGIDSLLDLSLKDKEFVIANATERMIKIRGLIGTPDIGIEKLQRFAQMGIDEVACLIDFGIPFSETMQSVQHLAKMQKLLNN